MSIGIYKITNQINNKSYIGQSNNIERRFKQHKNPSKHDLKHSYIDRSINKHGINNFSFEILIECSEEDLDKEEQKFIRLYATYQSGYNLTYGGDGTLGHNHSNETKLKISESKKGHYVSNETKNKLSKFNKFKTHPNNKTGLLNVHINKDKKYKQGFTWRYMYTKENGKRINIKSIDLNKLEKKVKSKGLPWKIIDKNKANASYEL